MMLPSGTPPESAICSNLQVPTCSVLYVPWYDTDSDGKKLFNIPFTWEAETFPMNIAVVPSTSFMATVMSAFDFLTVAEPERNNTLALTSGDPKPL